MVGGIVSPAMHMEYHSKEIQLLTDLCRLGFHDQIILIQRNSLIEFSLNQIVLGSYWIISLHLNVRPCASCLHQ